MFAKLFRRDGGTLLASDLRPPEFTLGHCVMPRKRWRTRLSSYPIRDIDPTIPVPIKDHEMVRAVLVDFDELTVLPSEAREQLVADLVESIGFRRCGVKVGKRGLSDEAVAQQILLSDIGRALERAGLP